MTNIEKLKGKMERAMESAAGVDMQTFVLLSEWIDLLDGIDLAGMQDHGALMNENSFLKRKVVELESVIAKREAAGRKSGDWEPDPSTWGKSR